MAHRRRDLDDEYTAVRSRVDALVVYIGKKHELLAGSGKRPVHVARRRVDAHRKVVLHGRRERRSRECRLRQRGQATDMDRRTAARSVGDELLERLHGAGRGIDRYGQRDIAGIAAASGLVQHDAPVDPGAGQAGSLTSTLMFSTCDAPDVSVNRAASR
jgi:hypothetical protein